MGGGHPLPPPPQIPCFLQLRGNLFATDGRPSTYTENIPGKGLSMIFWGMDGRVCGKMASAMMQSTTSHRA